MFVLNSGFDAAGKSTIVSRLLTPAGEPTVRVAPTVGFEIRTVRCGPFLIDFWDIGGQRCLRQYWSNYFHCCDGIIYVIDSTDSLRFEECRSELLPILAEQKLQKCKVLILANKQDLKSAFPVQVIKEKLRLTAHSAKVVDVQGCSAIGTDVKSLNLAVTSLILSIKGAHVSQAHACALKPLTELKSFEGDGKLDVKDAKLAWSVYTELSHKETEHLDDYEAEIQAIEDQISSDLWNATLHKTILGGN